ncbi:glycerophosphodiester phosphodiesterase family protein [Cognatilysobacter bugurensis]|uniref:Glycerophosphoryl diester phosphodiesterase n=1 Tax=Cognatilysobacter bugurensis TaxID=543356 RepID=A0A918SUM4_9GAMM|nr:glycerophosphodiester phosphodiesterase family protein [Lysobacter bugurensis]GHA72264.1 glycerophosphoryl diester phosphodiesterase [Lysobacter bugurensis]
MQERGSSSIHDTSHDRTTPQAAPDDRALLRGILVHDMRRDVRRHLRPMLAWYLLFTAFATVAAAPLTTWSLAASLHWIERPLAGDVDGLLDSALALAWLMLAAALTWFVVMLQQAGMLLVSASHGCRYRTAAMALLGVLRRAGPLAVLAGTQVLVHALLAVPWLALGSVLYEMLLSTYDPYYVVTARPPAMWAFIGAFLPVLIAGLLLHATLYFRWLLATPALVLEGLTPAAALARSRTLTRGRHLRIAVLVVGLALTVAVMPVIVTDLYSRAATPLLDGLPPHRWLMSAGMAGYLTFYAATALGVLFLGTTLNALLVRALFLRLGGTRASCTADPVPAHPGRFVWAAEGLFLVVALSQATLAVNSMNLRREVTITAHRGASAVAPENTLAAFKAAIDAGADAIELDVRLSADGVPVVFHDSDFLRLAGDPRRVVETPTAVIRELDVGRPFDPAFAGERVPTLREALTFIDRRATTIIELKPDAHNADALLTATLREIRRGRYQDRVMLASLSPELIRVARDAAPQAPLVLFANAALPGTARRTEFDMLGLNHLALDSAAVADARRRDYRLQVWTVNDPARMARYMDLGVDDISTDNPAAAVRVRAQREALTDAELLLARLRSWFGRQQLMATPHQLTN